MVNDALAQHVLGHRWLLVEVHSGSEILGLAPSLREAWLDLGNDGDIGFFDGVNYHSGRFAITAHTLVLTEIGSTLVGYVGRDPQILAAIDALGKLSEASDSAEEPDGHRSQLTVHIRVVNSLLELETTDTKLLFRRAGTLRQ